MVIYWQLFQSHSVAISELFSIRAHILLQSCGKSPRDLGREERASASKAGLFALPSNPTMHHSTDPYRVAFRRPLPRDLRDKGFLPKRDNPKLPSVVHSACREAPRPVNWTALIYRSGILDAHERLSPHRATPFGETSRAPSHQRLSRPLSGDHTVALFHAYFPDKY